ncbi:MAG: hypothetical protein Q8P80_01080 [Candidatus Levybacteria bacterium]|nr:hypothetical protein [Candidatus Levybacteria bacterium]
MHILFGISKEILFLFIVIPTALLGFIFPLTKVNKKPSRKKPIVFVHGWLNQNLLYYFLKRHLEKQGYQVYMTNFGLLTGDINQNAYLLSNFFEKKKLKNTILIGASLGSLIGFHYLQELEGWNRVEKFIAIGGPFMGFPLAKLFFFLKSGKQMSPNSKYLKDLFNKYVKNIEKIVCISSKYDEIVPANSSKIKGARSETLKIVGHVNLLAFSSQVYKLITNYASL